MQSSLKTLPPSLRPQRKRPSPAPLVEEKRSEGSVGGREAMVRSEGRRRVMLSKGVSERGLSKGVSERGLSKGVSERAALKGVSERAALKGVSERVLPKGVSERGSSKNVEEKKSERREVTSSEGQRDTTNGRQREDMTNGQRKTEQHTQRRVVPAIYREMFGNDEYEDDGFVVDDIDHSEEMKLLARHFARKHYPPEEEAIESTNDQIAIEEAYSTLQGRKEDRNAIL